MKGFRLFGRHSGFFCVALVTVIVAVGCNGTDPEVGFTGTTLDYELAATTVTVDEDTSSGVVSFGVDGEIVVSGESVLGGQVSEGTVLLFQASDITPNGLLRRVTSVANDGYNLVLTTEPATLEDAFDELHLVMNEAVESTASAIQMRSTIPGVTHKRIGGSGSVTYTDMVDFDKTVLYDHDGNKKTTDDQVVLNGSMSFSFGIRMEVDIGWGGLKKFAYTPVIKQKAEVEVSTTLAKWSQEDEIVVATFVVPFTVVVVPMVFNLDIVIGAEGKLEARVSTGMTLEASAESGVLYKDGRWSLTGGTNIDFDYDPPTLNASASLKGYVGLRGELLICGVVGPDLTVDGYLELSADINDDPWWELVAGLEGFVGIKGEILGAVLFEFESDDFINKKVTLADADGPFNPTACVPDCTGLECDPDPVCGQSCGTCGGGYSCQDGQCVEDICVPDCTGLECDPDPVCGQSCGTCWDGYSCQHGQCVEDICVPDCNGLECGTDPVCGQSCGECGGGLFCSDEGSCAPDGSTWEDVTTGLVWQVSPLTKLTFGSSRNSECDNLVFAGRDDWRMPTIEELRSLIRGCTLCVDHDPAKGSCGGCTQLEGPDNGLYWPTELEPHQGDTSFGSTPQRDTYWSSTSVGYLGGETQYGYVNFKRGSVSREKAWCTGGPDGDAYSGCLMAVRCVR